MPGRRNTDGKALSLFADVLREARHKAGLNSDELGEKLGYSGALIRSIESGHRVPKPDLAQRADEYFGYPKIFETMEERLVIAQDPDDAVTVFLDISPTGRFLKMKR